MATLKDRLYLLYEELQDQNYRNGRREFAERCNITKGQLNGYLNGTGETLWESLRNIARGNHVSVSWLLGETDDRIEADLKLKEILRDLDKADMELIHGLAEYLRSKKMIDEKEARNK